MKEGEWEGREWKYKERKKERGERGGDRRSHANEERMRKGEEE